MSALQDTWLRVSDGALHRNPIITEAGVVLGYDTVLVRRSGVGFALANDAERVLCLLSVLGRRPQSPRALRAFDRALACWSDGDKALAHLHLAFAGLPTVDTASDAWRLHQAGALIELGFAPRALAKELCLDPDAPLSKYSEDEPRNPHGPAGGRWTKDPVAADSIAFVPPPQTPAAASGAEVAGTEALQPPVPNLVETLGGDALDWLGRLAGRLALPAAVFGAVFVPSPNSGTSEHGAVPGRPGMSYRLDHDTGTLQLSQVVRHSLRAMGADGRLSPNFCAVGRSCGDAGRVGDQIYAYDEGPIAHASSL